MTKPRSLGLLLLAVIVGILTSVSAQQTQDPKDSKQAIKAFAQSLEGAGFLRSEELVKLLEELIREVADREHLIEALQRGDKAAALKGLRPIAEQGDPIAQLYIGLSYDRAIGVEQDYGEAVRWYRRAAGQGVTTAQNNLGVKYARGQGVDKDIAHAYAWLTLAADGGNDAAKKNLLKISGKLNEGQKEQAKRLIEQWRAK